MIKFGICPYCSRDSLDIPLEKKERTLICDCCKSIY